MGKERERERARTIETDGKEGRKKKDGYKERRKGRGKWLQREEGGEREKKLER